MSGRQMPQSQNDSNNFSNVDAADHSRDHRRLERDRRGDGEAARARAGRRAGPRRPPRGAAAGARRVAALPGDLRGGRPDRRRRPRAGRGPRRRAPRRRLTLLVNNAGASWRGSFAEGGYANVHRHMELNFDAVVRLTEALLPALRASAPAAIVNVASTAGRVSRARTGAYSASKFALIGWTDSLYAEERAARRPRRPGPARLHRHRGLPGGRAARESAHPLARLQARAGRRGDRRGRAGRQGGALRAASLRAGRGRPRRRPGPGPPGALGRRRRGADDQHGRRRSREGPT